MSGGFDPNYLLITSPTLGAVPNANKLVSFAGNTVTMTFPGYPSGILPNGNYTATFAPGTPNNAAGLAALGTAPLSFSFLQGDVTRNGVVNFDDLLIVAQNYGTSGKVFTTGNLDYDAGGTIDFSDLLILAQNYGASLFAYSPIASKNRIDDRSPTALTIIA